MEETKNAAALIINRQPYREYDSLVTVYTPGFGKLKLLARGTQKLKSKLAGHLEPLTLADIMIVSGKGFDYIGAALSREIYRRIREDLNKLYFAGQGLQIFERLVKESQADRSLFFLVTDWLQAINDHSAFVKESGELLLAAFIFKFLAELGYKPRLFECLVCGQPVKPGKNYFNLAGGGLLCESCQAGKKLSADTAGADSLAISDNCLKILRFIMDNKLERSEKINIDKKLVKELSVLAAKFIQYHF